MNLNEQAEQAVIGCLLVDNQSIYRMGGLEDIDFQDEVHRRLFTILRDVILDGRAVDTLTAQEFCEGDGEWAYLCEMARAVPSAVNAGSYAQILRRARARKSLGHIGRQLAENAAGFEDPAELVSETMLEMSRMMVRDRADMSYTESGALYDVHQQHDDRAVSTGLPTLDSVLGGGLRPGRLYVLGARPGCYKSAFAQQILMRACANGKGAGLLSLEMPPEEIFHRGKRAGFGLTSDMRIDCESYDIDAIAARIAEWKYRHDVSLVAVDYLQLIGGKGRNRFEVLCDISRRLKLLAKQFDIAILAPAQLSREVEKEQRTPRLSDLRECGNIEQDADCVLFIHHKPGNAEKDEEYSLIVAKQRSGMARCRPIKLMVDGPRFRVWEAA